MGKFYIKNIISVLTGALLLLTGCSRDDFYESGIQILFRVSVNSTEVKSSASMGDSEVLSLVSADGRFTVPMTCEVTGGINLNNVFAATKGTLINTGGSASILPDDGQFTVSAYKGESLQFSGVASKNGSFWTLDEPRYWDHTTMLTFYAYANSGEVAQTASSQTLTYAVPDNAADHQDILLGYYKGNGDNTGTADICFDHPLTAVLFRAGEMEDVTFRKISLCGLANSGSIVMDAAGSLGEWTVNDGRYEADSVLGDGETPLAIDNVYGKENVIGGSDGVFLVIPQDISSHNVLVTATVSTDEGDFVLQGIIDSGEWEAGNTNIYTLGF